MPQSVGRKLTTSRERTVRIRKVVGSIPIRSTIFKKNHRQFGGDFCIQEVWYSQLNWVKKLPKTSGYGRTSRNVLPILELAAKI